MDGRKQVGYQSSSSFTAELFGSNESSTSGIFGSIFAPSSKVLGRESVRSEVAGKKPDSTTEAWNTKPGTPDDFCKSCEGESGSTLNKETNSFYQERKEVQPCHLSSSIYYGGQEDIYNHPQSAQNYEFNSMFKKDGGEDDSGSASRGNWWQGSLYY